MFLNFLKSSGTQVDYISLLFDRTLRRHMRYLKNILKYVRKIYKRNIIHHFLINENRDYNTHLDGIKEKITEHMNWSRAGGSSVRVL